AIAAGNIPAFPARKQPLQPLANLDTQGVEIEIQLRLEPIDDIADVERIRPLRSIGMSGMGDEDQLRPGRPAERQGAGVDRLARADEVLAAKERLAVRRVRVNDGPRA